MLKIKIELMEYIGRIRRTSCSFCLTKCGDLKIAFTIKDSLPLWVLFEKQQLWIMNRFDSHARLLFYVQLTLHQWYSKMLLKNND